MEGESSDSDDSFASIESIASSYLASSPDDSSAVIVISSDSLSEDSNQSSEYFSSSSDSSSDSESNMSSSSNNSSGGSNSSNHSDETRIQMVANFTAQIPMYLQNFVAPEQEQDSSDSSTTASEAAVQNTDVETPPPPSSVGDAIVPQDEPQPGPSSAPSTSSQTTKTAVKRPASSMDAGGSDDDDEDQRCPICLDSWSGTGEHRLCSLACGHLFGKSCIERWMKKGVAGKRCPKCNHPCKKSDIRPLFATAVKVKETSGEEKLQQQLQQALKEKRELELQIIKQQMQLASMQKKETVPEQHNPTPVPAVGNGKYMFRLAKELPLGDKGGGRVMSFCPWATHLCVSRASKLCGYGLMDVYCERNFISHLMESLHGKMIRDMCHFPDQRNSMLLTASLDRSAKLVDFRCNLAAQTYRTNAPLWSCCWDTTGSAQDCHLVSLGMTSGEIARFDIRNVSADPMSTLNKRGSTVDQSPVSSLVALPAGYCPSLPRGGLIASQLNTCRLYVGDEDLEGTVLPFQSPFLSVRSEGITGHILVSTRASNGRPTNHTVYRLSRECNILPAELFEPVLSLQGANRQTLMTRPCIAALGDDELIVSANQEESRTVPIWSVSTAAQIGSLPTAEDVLDICNVSVNNSNFLGLLTDKKLSIYKFQV